MFILIPRIKKMYGHKSVLRDMAFKAFKGRYSGSRLGFWWAVFSPLLLALGINFIFTNVFEVSMENFVLFVLAGMLPWFFISSVVSEAMTFFAAHRPELKQNIFPRELIPISAVTSSLFTFLLGLAILLPLFFIFSPGAAFLLPYLLVVLLLYYIFALGLGLIFSLLSVFLKDLAHLIPTSMMLWFWATPIFYDVRSLKLPVQWVCLLNPLTYFMVSFQKILYEGAPPLLSDLSACLGFSVFFFIFGYLFFLRVEPELLKRI